MSSQASSWPKAALDGVRSGALPGVAELGVGGEDAGGELAGAQQRVAVARQAGELEVGHARLARPHHLPLAADLEVAVGELEPVVGLEQRLEARLRGAGLRLREQQAVRLLAAPPHAAAQLVELREAEALGALDDHDGRVGHVDADLDEAGGDEHLDLAGLEGAHDVVALGRT